MYKYFTIFVLFSSFLLRAEIRHLELGAANYSQGTNPDRYNNLVMTIKQLIANYGNSGIIFLNDIDEEGLGECSVYIKSMLVTLGHTDIEIILLPGDYRKIPLPKVNTLNLKYPDNDIIPARYQNKTTQRNAIRELIILAKHSKTGLKINHFSVDFDLFKSLLPPNVSIDFQKNRAKAYQVPHLPFGRKPKDIPSDVIIIKWLEPCLEFSKAVGNPL